MGSAPSVLSMVRVTSARPSGGRPAVPAKITSSILPPRSDLAPCSPMTQARASTTLDFPEPFGPTTQVIPGSKRRVVAEANDLKPRRVMLFRYTSVGVLAGPGGKAYPLSVPGRGDGSGRAVRIPGKVVPVPRADGPGKRRRDADPRPFTVFRVPSVSAGASG